MRPQSSRVEVPNADSCSDRSGFSKYCGAPTSPSLLDHLGSLLKYRLSPSLRPYRLSALARGDTAISADAGRGLI